MNTFRTAALTAAAVALTIVPVTTATAAAPTPRFLSASQLPAAPTPWTADPVRKGLPAEGSVCTAKITPKAGSSYRDFRTDLDTGARQKTTIAPTTAAAKALVAKLSASVAGCLDRLKEQYPTIEGETLYHGRVAVEEGAHIYSIDTSDTEIGSTDIALYAIGRDGRTVTVVEWGQLGDLDGAPLTGFKNTARTAVAKLY
ncbi:hypothetical protein [Streptomyces sp. NPDC058572]|uniref:hypothetical protein n=1 Tax=Streptomyces sp. NPDC058572 TaxID=3346546 RepID=UPI003649F9F6